MSRLKCLWCLEWIKLLFWTTLMVWCFWLRISLPDMVEFDCWYIDVGVDNIDIDRVRNEHPKEYTFCPSHPCIVGGIPTPKCCRVVVEILPKTMTNCQDCEWVQTQTHDRSCEVLLLAVVFWILLLYRFPLLSDAETKFVLTAFLSWEP